jgi:hypothetical protein
MSEMSTGSGRNHPLEGAMASAGQFECVDPEVGELLGLHAQNQLEGADRRLFAAHLQACARCAQEERVMREVALGIASLRMRPHPAAALPIGVSARPQSRTLRIAAVGAVAALLVVLLALSSRSTPDAQVAASTQALEARIQHLESQNAVLARTVATERARREASPLAGIPIAAPPNF